MKSNKVKIIIRLLRFSTATKDKHLFDKMIFMVYLLTMS